MNKYITIILGVASLLSCHKPKPCKTNNSDFNKLYQSILISNNNFIEDETLDTEIHAYTFSVSTPQQICAIGYKSLPAISGQKYNMVLVDSLNNNVLFSINEIFNSTTTSYVSLTNTIELAPGIKYTINRIQENWNPYITNAIGRVLLTQNYDSLSFPYSNSEIQIYNTSFYSLGGPLYNIGIPYIDIIFKE